MNHRVGPAFVIVALLAFPLTAQAQVAPTGSWAGPGRPQNWPAHAQAGYGQTTYPQGYLQPASASRAYYPLAPAPTPAAYAYNGHPGYGAPYPTPSYGQGYPATPAASWGTARAEAPAPLVPTKDNLHYVQMGMGGFIPTDSGNTSKLGLEANLWALRGGWVPNSGLYLTLDASTGFDVGCMAKSASDGCKGHFRIHWIGVGPFFNTGTPMIASHVQRSWDLMAFAGAEVRLFKGMTVKGTVNWFLASPWGVYAHYKQQAEASLNGAAATPSTALSPGAASAAAEELDPGAAVSSVLGHALRHPQISLTALWEF